MHFFLENPLTKKELSGKFFLNNSTFSGDLIRNVNLTSSDWRASNIPGQLWTLNKFFLGNGFETEFR